MQQWIDLNTKVAHDSLATLMQFGELNLKTASSFYGQQKEMYADYQVNTKSNVEKLAAAKDPQSYFKLQNEIFQDSVASALGNWKKNMAVMISSQEAYRTLAEETMQLAKSNLELTAASVKQTTENVERAVKPKVRELTEETMQLTKNNIEQAAASVRQTTEAVEKAVQSTIK